MKDNEHILDSGEIYKDLEPLELPLGDEEAHEIDWSSVIQGKGVKPGGHSFKTHNLIALNEVIWFVPVVSIYLIGGIFLILGLSISGLACYFFLNGYQLLAFFAMFPIGILAIILGVANITKYSIIVLHKRIGLYWKGKKESTKINEIKAIQLIKESVTKTNELSNLRGLFNLKEKYFSYEINLVLKDGNRINVVDHANEKAANKQAMRLAQFLDVPLLKRKH